MLTIQNRDQWASPFQYPFVVEPAGDHWEILFVRCDRPYRVAEFSTKEEALKFAKSKNDEWYFTNKAEYYAKRIIEAAADKARSSTEEKLRLKSKLIAKLKRWFRK